MAAAEPSLLAILILSYLWGATEAEYYPVYGRGYDVFYNG